MNKKDVCATKIAYVRFTEDDLADLDNQVRRVGRCVIQRRIYPQFN